MKFRHVPFTAAVLALGLATVACEDKPSAKAAPKSSALAPAKPKSPKASTFEVKQADSKVTFLMDAPLEKIHGEAPGSLEGELFVDLMDVTKTTGLLKVDLDKLSLFQQKRDDEKSEYGDKQKNDTQNEHARTWLEISEDTPDDVRKKNRYIEYKIEKIEVVDGKANINEMKGGERKVKLKVTGDFRLHQRTVKKTAEIEATFHYDGPKPTKVEVKTTKAFDVDLEEHDVRPREAFGKLAEKTLGALGQKVDKNPKVSLEYTATVKAGAAEKK